MRKRGWVLKIALRPSFPPFPLLLGPTLVKYEPSLILSQIESNPKEASLSILYLPPLSLPSSLSLLGWKNSAKPSTTVTLWADLRQKHLGKPNFIFYWKTHLYPPELQSVVDKELELVLMASHLRVLLGCVKEHRHPTRETERQRPAHSNNNKPGVNQ